MRLGFLYGLKERCTDILHAVNDLTVFLDFDIYALHCPRSIGLAADASGIQTESFGILA